MGSELGGFKSRFFGGFDRKDVIDYIEKAAAERNELTKEKEKLVEENEKLNEKISAISSDLVLLKTENRELKSKLEEAENSAKSQEESLRELRETIISDTMAALEELSKKCDDINASFDSTSEKVNEALSNMREKTLELPDIKKALFTRMEDLKKLSINGEDEKN